MMSKICSVPTLDETKVFSQTRGDASNVELVA